MSKRKFWLPAVLSMSFLLMACASQVPVPQVIERPGLDSISSSGTASTAYIKKHSETDRFCEGRGVDAVETTSSGLSISGSLPAGPGAGIGNSSSAGALGLGGRDPEVLLARELLYRACELTLNLNLGLEDTKEIYFRFLQTIETVSGNHASSGTAVQGFQQQPTISAENQ